MATIGPNLFDQRQTMQGGTFEIFHYNNAGSCTCPPHRHDHFELFCLLSDALDYIVDGHRYPMVPGSIILIAPGQIHRPYVSGPPRDVERLLLWLNADYVRAFVSGRPKLRFALFGDMTGRNAVRPDDEDAKLMRLLMQQLHRESAEPDPDSDMMSRAIVSQLLIHLGRAIEREPEALPRRTDHRYHEVMRICEHIDRHLAEPLSVSGLAEAFFMDKNTLTRQFKRMVGMTPGDYIRRRRLIASRLMIAGGAGMQETCAECGFSDYSAFYRAFRQAYDMSPSDFAAMSAKAPGDEKARNTHEP